MNSLRACRPVFSGRIALLLLLALPAAMPGQGRRSDAALYEPGAPFRCEAWNAPSADSTLSRLDVHLWIQPGLLIFKRQEGDTSAAPFAGAADISIEVFDSTHTARARKYLRGGISSSSSDGLNSRAEPLRVSASFDLPPGTYTVAAEVADAESQRRTSKEQRATLRSYRAGALEASSLLWCEETGHSGSADANAVFYGSVIPLGHAARGYVAVGNLSGEDSLHVVFRLFKAGSDAKGSAVVMQDSFWTRGAAGRVPTADTVLGCRYLPDGAQIPGIVLISLPLASDTLVQGPYRAELLLSGQGRSATVRQDLMIQWMDMPRTLASLSLAVQALQYVMTKEEYASLRSENGEAQRRTFEAFWRRKNPSPKSAFNAYMEEYYRRADIAEQDFATIRSPSGISTDRGKVLILYGQPESKERVLGTSTAPREIWYYPALNRSLIFIDEKRTGDYTLLTEQ